MNLDMQDEKLHEMMLVKTKDLLSKVDKEKPDLDIDLSVTSALMRRTIRLNPKHRSLKHAIQVMIRYVLIGEAQFTNLYNSTTQPCHL